MCVLGKERRGRQIDIPPVDIWFFCSCSGSGLDRVTDPPLPETP